jgi:hypothetical protein
MVVPETAEVAGEAGSAEETAEVAGGTAEEEAVEVTVAAEVAAPSHTRLRTPVISPGSVAPYYLVRPWQRPELRAAGPERGRRRSHGRVRFQANADAVVHRRPVAKGYASFVGRELPTRPLSSRSVCGLFSETSARPDRRVA